MQARINMIKNQIVNDLRWKFYWNLTQDFNQSELLELPTQFWFFPIGGDIWDNIIRNQPIEVLHKSNGNMSLSFLFGHCDFANFLH